MQVDVLFRNGSFVRSVDTGERLGFVAVSGGRIVATGKPGDEGAIEAGRVVDLAGQTVLPGLIDSHVHLMSTGLALETPQILETTVYSELRDIVVDLISQWSDRELLLVHGVGLGRLDHRPNRVDLDVLCNHKPLILLDRGGHSLCLNSKASELASSVLQPGLAGEALRDGFVVGVANTWLRNWLYAQLPDGYRVGAFARGARAAAAAGLTTVHALEGGEGNGKACFSERDAEILLDLADRLPVRTVLYYQTTNVSRVEALGLPRIGGCLWVDGSYGEHTAALLEPYADEPASRGVLYFSDEELFQFIFSAHQRRLQVAMHAIGDAAIEQLLNTYEKVLRRAPRADHRHRIEHFSLPLPRHIEMAADLGVHLGMQPIFASRECTEANLRWLGAVRLARRHPYRTIGDAGIVVGAGSDSEAMPLEPFPAVSVLVNHPDPERCLSVNEALRLFTLNNARLAFEEKDKGSLEVGKLADMTVVDGDPFASGCCLERVRAVMTVVGGEVVYRAGSKAP